jgi:hypothetical protein
MIHRIAAAAGQEPGRWIGRRPGDGAAKIWYHNTTIGKPAVCLRSSAMPLHKSFDIARVLAYRNGTAARRGGSYDFERILVARMSPCGRNAL